MNITGHAVYSAPGRGSVRAVRGPITWAGKHSAIISPMTCLQPRLRRRLLVAAALSIACGDAPTTPGDDGGQGLGHPVGTPSGKLTIGGTPSGIAVSPNGIGFVTMLDSNGIARFSAAAPAALMSPLFIAVHPWDVAFNRDGNTALVAAADPARWVVYSVDVRSGDVPYARAILNAPYRVAVARDDSRLFVLTYGDPARVYSIALNDLFGARQYLQQIPGLPRSITVSPTTGAVFVTTNYRVARLDPDTVGIQAISFVPIGSENSVLSPDGSRVWFGSPAGNLVALDANSLEQVAEVATGGKIYGVAMSPDGAQLWATSADQLLIVDTAAGSIVTQDRKSVV